MLFVVEVDVDAGDYGSDAKTVETAVAERLRGASAHVPGGTATVTHCRRLTSELIDKAFDNAKR